MKKKSLLILAIFGMMSHESLRAQQIYGFQIPSRQVFYFTVGYTGQYYLGAGYAQRRFGVWEANNVDVSAEIQFPLTEMYLFRNYECIVGGSSVFGGKGRAKPGAGAFLHIIRNVSNKGSYLTLAPQFILAPTYIYAAPLDSRPGGSVALRASCQPAVATWNKSGGSKSFKWFSGYRLHAGIHADLILQRSLSLTLDPYMSFQKKANDYLPKLSDKINFKGSWGQWYPEVVKAQK